MRLSRLGQGLTDVLFVRLLLPELLSALTAFGSGDGWGWESKDLCSDNRQLAIVHAQFGPDDLNAGVAPLTPNCQLRDITDDLKKQCKMALEDFTKSCSLGEDFYRRYSVPFRCSPFRMPSAGFYINCPFSRSCSAAAELFSVGQSCVLACRRQPVSAVSLSVPQLRTLAGDLSLSSVSPAVQRRFPITRCQPPLRFEDEALSDNGQFRSPGTRTLWALSPCVFLAAHMPRLVPPGSFAVPALCCIVGSLLPTPGSCFLFQSRHRL